MNNLNDTRPEFIQVSRFQSIKTKVLIFALLATIVPSVILGGLSYFQNSKLLKEKISNELGNAMVQATGKLDLWLKERLYDLRVFSSSYIISENLEAIIGTRQEKADHSVALGHIKEYLKSVSDKFGVYDELILVNLKGDAMVTGSAESPDSVLPAKWVEQLRATPLIRGKTTFAPYISERSIMVAEVVRSSEGTPLGILAAQIKLSAIRTILIEQTQGGIAEIYLIDSAGRLLVSTAPESQAPENEKQLLGSSAEIMKQPKMTFEYTNYHKKSVIGMAAPIKILGWFLVAEAEKEKAYADIIVLRHLTVILVSGLILCIGLIAWLFGHAIVQPVRRLSSEAAKVASGNLDVDIPVQGLSEVSYLTQVFNHMVANLRRGQEEISTANEALLASNKELHKISITDGLTDLYNRKHIMELFDREMARSVRGDRALSILMLDIDHFKIINDTYGHQAGDNVMRQLAATMVDTVRECDHVGRYGGEEFLVILPDCGIQNAAVTAERIRHKLNNLKFNSNTRPFGVTVSIGISGYPVDGDQSKILLKKADDALYQAKAEGRNRINLSAEEDYEDSAKVHVL